MKKFTIILAAILAIGISLRYLGFDQKQEDAAVRDELPAPSMQMDLNYGRIPMHFEPNLGQAGEGAKFLARGRGYTLLLTSTEAVFLLRKSDAVHTIDNGEIQMDTETPQSSHTIRLKLVGANPASEVEGLGELPGKSNYFIGNDPDKWRTGVSNYAKVKYNDVYPGIDLIYYGNQSQLEYDFVVAPGIDPGKIVMEFKGMKHLHLDKSGNLVLDTGEGEVTLQAPMI